MDAIELAKASFVELDGPRGQLDCIFWLEVIVDLKEEREDLKILTVEFELISRGYGYLVEVFGSSFCSPSFLEMGVPEVVLLSLIWTRHFTNTFKTLTNFTTLSYMRVRGFVLSLRRKPH